jgi:LysW-gamma-L-lysine carboxypeptidase
MPGVFLCNSGTEAVEAAVKVWEALREWAAGFNADRERAFDRLQLTLRGMDSSNNGFEERASLRVGARLPPDLPQEKWYLQMKQIPGIRQAGGEPGFVLKTGTADMNLVAPAWSCPVLVYGLGDSSLDRTPQEHLPLEEYRKSVDMLAAVVSRLGKPV